MAQMWGSRSYGLLFWPLLRNTVKVRTREAAVREAWKTDDDRGAVLFILLLFLVIFIAVATLAVDLASQGARGQDLQNTSDAAALAGVVEYQEQILDGATRAEAVDAAELVVEEVMRQNGIDPADGDIELDVVVSDDGSKLQVVIKDLDPDQFLPNDLLGETLKLDDQTVERSATAEFLACENECSLIVKIEKSIGAISARGNGDGYKPILVNQKLYAINHNSNDRQIVCVSTITEAPCWADGVARDAYASSVGFFSPNPEMPHTAVVGTRIYWSATDKGNGHRLFCWETASGLDVPCTDAVLLNSSLRRFDNRDDDNTLSNFKDENRGGGTFTVLGEKVFSFTDDHRIHCFDPSIGSYCSGYSNIGNNTSLGDAGVPASSPIHGNHGSSIDRIVDKSTGYVYATLHIPFAQNVDCTSPLADPAGQRVVVRNELTGNYLSSQFPDLVTAEPDGASAAQWWDVENFGGDTISLQNAAHGEYLDAGPFVGTSISRGEDDRWDAQIVGGVGGGGDSYFINSENLDFEAGSLFDDAGSIIEEVDPPSSPEAEWNFYDWECGVDPDRVDPGPDWFVDGTWLHCYDTGVISGSPGQCPGFAVSGVDDAPAGTPTPIHPDGTRFSGRLWFYYDRAVEGAGDPAVLGVCSSGYSTWNDPAEDFNLDPDSIEVNCVNIGSGNFSNSLTADMNGVASLIQTYTGSDPGAWGDPHWNSTENRLFYPTEHDTPRILCYDFDDNTLCDDITGTVPPNPTGITLTEDYGFFSDGNCVYALGHTAFFWAFKASDVGEPCDAIIPPARVERCACGDGATFRWGELDFSEVDLSRFESFGVRIMTDDGGDGTASLPIFPGDGSFLSIKPGGVNPRIPLDDLAIPEGAESILVVFDVTGLDEDAIEDVGDFEIRFAQRPKLID